MIHAEVSPLGGYYDAGGEVESIFYSFFLTDVSKIDYIKATFPLVRTTSKHPIDRLI